MTPDSDEDNTTHSLFDDQAWMKREPEYPFRYQISSFQASKSNFIEFDRTKDVSILDDKYRIDRPIKLSGMITPTFINEELLDEMIADKLSFKQETLDAIKRHMEEQYMRGVTDTSYSSNATVAEDTPSLTMEKIDEWFATLHLIELKQKTAEVVALMKAGITVTANGYVPANTRLMTLDGSYSEACKAAYAQIREEIAALTAPKEENADG